MGTERIKKWVKSHPLEVQFLTLYIGAPLLAITVAATATYGSYIPEYWRQYQESLHQKYPDHLLRPPSYSPSRDLTVKTR